MRKRSIALIVFLVSLACAYPTLSRTTHELADLLSELQAYLGSSRQGYVTAGCTHATSGTTQASIASCKGYVLDKGNDWLMTHVRDTSAKTVTYSGGNGIYYLILHKSTTAAVGGWTRSPAGSHYLWQVAAQQPALPNGAAWAAQVTVAGGQITAVSRPKGFCTNSRCQWYRVTDPLFGATGDGLTNDAAAINATFDAGTNQCNVFFPPPSHSYYIGSTTLNMKEGCLVKGQHWRITEIVYNGTGSALRYNQPTVNSSGYAMIEVTGLKISGGNAASTGAAIELNAGGYAYFDIHKNRLTGSYKYGVLSDAAALVSIYENIIENGSGIAESANVWHTNGDERTPGQNPNFGNVVRIFNNQFNSARYAAAIDGGLGIYIYGNNMNGHVFPVRLAGVQTGKVSYNSFEGHSTAGVVNLYFTDRSVVAGGAVPDKGISYGVVVEGNYFNTSISGTAAVVFTSVTGNYNEAITARANTFACGVGRVAPASGGAFDITWLRNAFIGHNRDAVCGGIGTRIHYVGKDLDASLGTMLYPDGEWADSLGQVSLYGDTLERAYFPGGIHNSLPVAIESDQSVTSTTTLADVTGLSIPVIAHEKWVAHGWLDLSNALSTTGVKLAVTVPAGATMNLVVHVACNSESDANGFYVKRTGTSGAELDFTASNMTGCTAGLAHVTLWVSNGATNGAAQVKIAQSTSSGTALVVRAGSNLVGTRKS